MPFTSLAQFITTVALAQGRGAIEPPSSIGILSGNNAGNTAISLMCVAAQWIFNIAIILSILLAIVTAIQYMTSGGNPEKVGTAHRRLLYITIGIAVAIIARTLPVLVGAILKVQDPARLGGVC